MERGCSEGQINISSPLGSSVDFFQQATPEIAVSVNATTRNVLKHYQSS